MTDELARETAPPPVCSCGRCDGRGALFITTTGAEEWRPHRGRTGYDPKEASRYGYGGWKR